MKKSTNVLVVGYYDKSLGKLVFYASESMQVTDFQSAAHFTGRKAARVVFNKMKRDMFFKGRKDVKLEIIRVIMKRGKP